MTERALVSEQTEILERAVSFEPLFQNVVS